MSASSEMPYFIKPSIEIVDDQKEELYNKSITEITAIIGEESNDIIKMVTINTILKCNLPYFYWVGFYLVRNGRLEVGPYQGTLGCLYIDFSRGVCGKAAREMKTQIVQDCHTLTQGEDHIACDPNSKSEIVVPVINNSNKLIAVLDVDSTLTHSFNHIDQKYLEEIVSRQFGLSNLV